MDNETVPDRPQGRFSDLDKWVRRRRRMCIWKQWKTGRSRAANLMKLGIAEHEAFTHGMSRECRGKGMLGKGIAGKGI